jgi:hypothetical protein
MKPSHALAFIWAPSMIACCIAAVILGSKNVVFTYIYGTFVLLTLLIALMTNQSFKNTILRLIVSIFLLYLIFDLNTNAEIDGSTRLERAFLSGSTMSFIWSVFLFNILFAILWLSGEKISWRDK